MEQLHESSSTRIVVIGLLSLTLHLVTLGALQYVPPQPRVMITEKVQVQITEKPRPEAPTPPPPAPVPETPPPPRAQRAPQPTQARAPDKAVPPPPVLGLSPSSVEKDGNSSFSVPVGNTTDAPDEGKRLTPEEVQALKRDLSQDAELIVSTFIAPPYTAEAEDAGLEGLFVVEVYVDMDGKVTDAELRSKIGYGMDARVLNTARQAKFKPRRDSLGKPLAGWTEIKVRLTLE